MAWAAVHSKAVALLLYIHSSIAIILMGKRELVALLNLSSWCLVMVEWLFLAMPRGCLRFVIVVFPDHTHLLFLLILRGCFGFCTHFIASSERDIPVIWQSELIKTRTRVKTNCLNFVIFRNDPLSIHWRTAWTGLSKSATLFNNLNNGLLKNMVYNIFWFLNYFTIIALK